MGRLKNKVAIVTGAANGIGEGIARMFADEGAKVTLTDVDSNRLKQVVQEINDKNESSAIGIEHDVTKMEDWEKVIEETVKNFEKIDVLVNNAGISGLIAGFDETSLEEWNKVMDINSTGAFIGTKLVSKEMEKQNKGSIINISSVTSHCGSPQASIPYTASKGSIRSLTKASAALLGKKANIRVNSIHPGTVLTPMAIGGLSESQIEGVKSLSPMNIVGELEDIAYPAVFLASDEARFMTGSEMVVDGGWLMYEQIPG